MVLKSNAWRSKSTYISNLEISLEFQVYMFCCLLIIWFSQKWPMKKVKMELISFLALSLNLFLLMDSLFQVMAALSIQSHQKPGHHLRPLLSCRFFYQSIMKTANAIDLPSSICTLVSVFVSATLFQALNISRLDYFINLFSFPFLFILSGSFHRSIPYPTHLIQVNIRWFSKVHLYSPIGTLILPFYSCLFYLLVCLLLYSLSYLKAGTLS